jgi:hypothetical protein
MEFTMSNLTHCNNLLTEAVDLQETVVIEDRANVKALVLDASARLVSVESQ